MLVERPVHTGRVFCRVRGDGKNSDTTPKGCDQRSAMSGRLNTTLQKTDVPTHAQVQLLRQPPIAMSKKANTTQRGYGHAHQKTRQRLIYNHRDGTPCWWCALPMYRDKTQNWDQQPLAADHSTTNGAATGQHADRLLHGKCNSQAAGHARDHLRPALTGQHPSQPLPKTLPATGAPFTWG